MNKLYVQDPDGTYREVSPEDLASLGLISRAEATKIGTMAGEFIKSIADAEVRDARKAVGQMGDDVARLADALEPFVKALPDAIVNYPATTTECLYVDVAACQKAKSLLARPDIAAILDMYRYGAASEHYKKKDPETNV